MRKTPRHARERVIVRNDSAFPPMTDGGPAAMIRHMESNTTAVELAERVNDGLQVLLWWDRPTGRLWVEIVNRLGVTVTVDAPPDHALDVFYHPFAHCDGAVEGLLAVA